MQFPLPFTNTLVLPVGATTGTRIVLDGTNGTIFVYNSSNQLVVTIAGAGGPSWGAGVTSQVPGGPFIQLNQGVEVIGNGVTQITIRDYRGYRLYNLSGVGLGNLIASEMSTSMVDSAGNAVLQGTTTYFNNAGVWYAFNLNNGQLQIMTATTEAGPWSTQATISLYDGSNVGGITINGPTVRISSANDSGLEMVNGVNSWPAEELLAYTPVDQPINTQTNLTQDVYLSFSTLQPSAVYDVQGAFYFTGPVSTNFKWAYAIGATGDYFIANHVYTATGGTFGESSDIYTASATPTHAALTNGTSFSGGNGQTVLLSGTYLTAAAAASPGVFGLMWAQNTSNTGNLSLRKGSKLTLRRIA